MKMYKVKFKSGDKWIRHSSFIKEENYAIILAENLNDNYYEVEIEEYDSETNQVLLAYRYTNPLLSDIGC